jgi:hypothetical protein
VIWRGKVSLITITSSSPPLKKCPRLSLACPFLLVSLDADIAEGNTKKKKHCSTVFVSRLGDVDVVRHIDFLRSGFDLEGWLRRRRP